jgi:nicotinic acid mononucleotide adenylyltransferase
MNIQEMLNKIKHKEPLEIDELEESTTLLRLSDEDIKQLVDFSIIKQPQVKLLPSGKRVDLLTKLMCMGTEQDRSHDLTSPLDNKDKYIGYKDSRIERYIIQKAIEKAACRKKNAPEEAILGLSANPPTINHGLYIQHLMKIYSTLHVIINAQSPLKQGYPSHYPSGEARLHLLNTMLKSEGILLKEPQLILDTLEIDRDPPSRAIATLALLLLKSNDIPNYSLILGLDGLFSFTRWYRWVDFAKLCEIKIYPRSGIHYTQEEWRETLERLINNGQELTLVANTRKLKTTYDALCNTLNNELLTCTYEEIMTFEGSATDVRKFYETGNNVHAKHPNVSESVHNLIIERGYYTQDTP